MNHRLQVVFLTRTREQERRVVVHRNWSSDRALVDALLLEWFGDGEIIPGIENRIAEGKVERAVQLRRAWLGDDLNPASARTVGLHTVRVVVDMCLRNGGSRDSSSLHLYAVDNQAHATGGNPGLVGKGRE